MTVTIALILLALIAWGLERNHLRQPYPRPLLNGCSDVHDRDSERVRAELRAAADWAKSRPSGVSAVNDHATSNQGSR
jgi:hypothetical protein